MPTSPRSILCLQSSNALRSSTCLGFKLNIFRLHLNILDILTESLKDCSFLELERSIKLKHETMDEMLDRSSFFHLILCLICMNLMDRSPIPHLRVTAQSKAAFGPLRCALSALVYFCSKNNEAGLVSPAICANKSVSCSQMQRRGWPAHLTVFRVKRAS